MIRRHTLGFTLIELLVVIAIIAILSTLGLSAFTNSQMRARDAKRRADIKSMQDSFEQYYPGNSNAYNVACAPMATYLQGAALPTDPRSGAAYNCTSAVAQYCACATLEVLGTGNATTLCGALGAPPTWGTPVAGAQGYYCVRSLQ